MTELLLMNGEVYQMLLKKQVYLVIKLVYVVKVQFLLYKDINSDILNKLLNTHIFLKVRVFLYLFSFLVKLVVLFLR